VNINRTITIITPRETDPTRTQPLSLSLPEAPALNGISTSAWFPIARLLRPQGRRGELLADPLSDLPGLFDNQHDVVLAAANASVPAPGATPLRIEEHWLPTGKNAGRVVLKLSGCDSISAAEALAGQLLLIPCSQLPALDPGTFFVGDLLGCTIYNVTSDNPAGDPIGTVVDVEFATAPDGRTRLEDAAPLLSVERTGLPARTPPAEPILIPFVLAWIDAIDIAARRITMHLPDGLLEPPDAPASYDDLSS
jgi:16S rRNA processing protein RimM